MNRKWQSKNMEDIDIALELLASAVRRRLLRYLLNESEPDFKREELAHSLSENRSEAASLRVNLAHRDLPKLAEAGLIEYDHRSGAVRPTETIEEMRPLLEVCDKIEGSEG